MKNNYIINTGCLINEHSVLLTSVPEDIETFTEYSRIDIWSNKNSKPTTIHYEVDDWIKRAIRFTSRPEHFDGVVLLGINGKVFFYQDGQFEIEIIEDAKNWGYLFSITQIGQTLYVCGDRGQVYKRLDKNHWVHCDQGVLSKKDIQSVVDNINKHTIEQDQNIQDWLMSLIDINLLEQDLVFLDIKGISNNNIYICGHRYTDKGNVGIIYYYDGLTWEEIESPTTDTLSSIFINDNHDEVYIGGKTGYLLKGNYWQGFEDISDINILATNNSMLKIGQSLYINTADGLRELVNGKLQPTHILSFLALQPDDDKNAVYLLDTYQQTALFASNKYAYLLNLNNNHCQIIPVKSSPLDAQKNKNDITTSIQPLLATTPTTLADTIAERVGCYEIYNWLVKLEQDWQLPPFTFCPFSTKEENIVHLKQHGIKLVLKHQHRQDTAEGELSRWILTDVHFYIADADMGNWAEQLPFAINKETETPETLINKLGNDTTGILSDHRQSYFLQDRRVIEVTWQPNLQGISHLWITRLGDPINFETLNDKK